MDEEDDFFKKAEKHYEAVRFLNYHLSRWRMDFDDTQEFVLRKLQATGPHSISHDVDEYREAVVLAKKKAEERF